jgi:hypothetical protein
MAILDRPARERIDPERLYTVREFCHWFPTRSGRRLSIDVARRWAKRGRYGFFDRTPAEKRTEFVIRGRELLAAVAMARSRGGRPR